MGRSHCHWTAAASLLVVLIAHLVAHQGKVAEAKVNRPLSYISIPPLEPKLVNSILEGRVRGVIRSYPNEDSDEVRRVLKEEAEVLLKERYQYSASAFEMIIASAAANSPVVKALARKLANTLHTTLHGWASWSCVEQSGPVSNLTVEERRIVKADCDAKARVETAKVVGCTKDDVAGCIGEDPDVIAEALREGNVRELLTLSFGKEKVFGRVLDYFYKHCMRVGVADTCPLLPVDKAFVSSHGATLTDDLLNLPPHYRWFATNSYWVHRTKYDRKRGDRMRHSQSSLERDLVVKRVPYFQLELMQMPMTTREKRQLRTSHVVAAADYAPPTGQSFFTGNHRDVDQAWAANVEAQQWDRMFAKWNSGEMVWSVVEDSDYGRAADEACLKKTAGPSGTTNRTFFTARFLGIAGDALYVLRLVMIAYLVPFQHSLVEVLLGAAPFVHETEINEFLFHRLLPRDFSYTIEEEWMPGSTSEERTINAASWLADIKSAISIVRKNVATMRLFNKFSNSYNEAKYRRANNMYKWGQQFPNVYTRGKLSQERALTDVINKRWPEAGNRNNRPESNVEFYDEEFAFPVNTRKVLEDKNALKPSLDDSNVPYSPMRIFVEEFGGNGATKKFELMFDPKAGAYGREVRVPVDNEHATSPRIRGHVSEGNGNDRSMSKDSSTQGSRGNDSVSGRGDSSGDAVDSVSGRGDSSGDAVDSVSGRGDSSGDAVDSVSARADHDSGQLNTSPVIVVSPAMSD